MAHKYTADFETNNSVTECRVWAYAICEIGNIDNFIYGNNIEDFIKWCEKVKGNPTLFFHNLKFDGCYIISYLLQNGYEWVDNRDNRRDKTFTTLITDMGIWYQIEIYFKVTSKRTVSVKINDSLKILNFSVDKIAKDFKLPISKLEIDYNEIRPIGHILTDQEVDYIRNDVTIMAMALDIMFKAGLTKMTIGSDAISNYKDTITCFSDYFPMLTYEEDEVIRKSYRGGWTYANPKWTNKQIGEGIVIDKNSMYPYQLSDKLLPFGRPEYYDGHYKEDITYPLWVETITAKFDLKPNMLPTLQLKNTLGFIPNEYIETTKGEYVTITLTSVDYELLVTHYDVDVLEYHGGYKFKGIKGLFTNYVNKWMTEKNKAKKEDNASMYVISKLCLNSLYGKFGLNPNTRSKKPYLTEDKILKFELLPREIRDSIYVPVASFTTAYARMDIISNAQAIRDYSLSKYGKDYFLYSDTDSIHAMKLEEDELIKFMEIDDYKLGAYKVESTFRKACFIRQKCYIEEDYEGIIHSTIAGLPKKLGTDITFENFKKGFTTSGKLRFMQVPNGVILVPTDFTIK